LPEARRRRLVLFGFQEVGEAGKALAGRGEVGEAVLGEAQKDTRNHGSGHVYSSRRVR
jgi:hypothetical protein